MLLLVRTWHMTFLSNLVFSYIPSTVIYRSGVRFFFKHARSVLRAHHAVTASQVAITSFFRNSSQFSYAALVAAFTAVVIFTGSNTVLGADGEAVSLARIINTVVGSVVYLFVDLLLGKDIFGVALGVSLVMLLMTGGMDGGGLLKLTLRWLWEENQPGQARGEPHPHRHLWQLCSDTSYGRSFGTGYPTYQVMFAVGFSTGPEFIDPNLRRHVLLRWW